MDSFSYMGTVTLSILRICEAFYTKNSLVGEKLVTASELVRLESKCSKSHRSSIVRQSGTPSSPVEEGITSPRSFSSRHSFRAHGRRPTLPVSPLSSPTITVDPAREGLLLDQNGVDHIA